MRKLASSGMAGGVIVTMIATMPMLAPEAAGAAMGQADESPATTSPASSNSTQFVTGPNGEILFRMKGPNRNSVLKFEQVAKSATEGRILNSRQGFDLMRLPATFKAVLSDDDVCTATLIGPRVILTAAHCIDTKFFDEGAWQTVQGSVAPANSPNKKKKFRFCDMAPAYTASPPAADRVRNQHDFALCELYEDFKGVVAENIFLDAPAAATGKRLMLAGFGCTNSDLTDGAITLLTKPKPNSVLNIGFNTVQSDSDGWRKLEGRVGTDAAILCPGDSGGASFAGVDLNAGHDRGWKIVAVNSSVGLGASPPNLSYISYLAPLSDPEFRSFVDGWVRARPTFRKICGLDPSATKCRK